MRRAWCVMGMMGLACAQHTGAPSQTSEATQPAEPTPVAEVAAVDETPSTEAGSWSASYMDGSNNQFRFWQDGEAVRFSYEPVQPLESNSGFYSGGEPREGVLTEEQVGTLKGHLDALSADREQHASQRTKGTGAVSFIEDGVQTSFYVVPAALESLESFLEACRGGEPHMTTP